MLIFDASNHANDSHTNIYIYICNYVCIALAAAKTEELIQTIRIAEPSCQGTMA